MPAWMRRIGKWFENPMCECGCRVHHRMHWIYHAWYRLEQENQ